MTIFTVNVSGGIGMIKMILDIEGMSCGMCESHINDTIRRQFAVKKVCSSNTKGKTEIIAEKPLDAEKLRKAVRETGYEVLNIKTEAYVKKGLFGGIKICQRKKENF